MSRTFHHGGSEDRQIRVHGVRKEHPDLRRLARALIEFAQMQAEVEAQATDVQKPAKTVPDRSKDRRDSQDDDNEAGAA